MGGIKALRGLRSKRQASQLGTRNRTYLKRIQQLYYEIEEEVR